MSSNFNVVEMNDISKSFFGVKVLDNVSFAVTSGEIHALAGENGAGKSTLMKILQGVYTLDSGEIQVAGEKAWFSKSSRSSLNYQLPKIFSWIVNIKIDFTCLMRKKQSDIQNLLWKS